MKVALYARVSTVDKEQNPETQLRVLREWAVTQKHEVYREYVDQASAMDRVGRVAWKTMIEDAHGGQFELLATTRIDRAWRSVLDCATELETLSNMSVGYVSVLQPIDTRGAVGRLMLSMLAAFAEFERGLIQERVLEGIARARAEGKHMGRPVGARDKVRRKRAGYFARHERARK